MAPGQLDVFGAINVKNEFVRDILHFPAITRFNADLVLDHNTH